MGELSLEVEDLDTKIEYVKLDVIKEWLPLIGVQDFSVEDLRSLQGLEALRRIGV